MAETRRRAYAGFYQWSVVVAGGATLALVRPAWHKSPAELITLIVLFALAEYFPTRVRVGAITFSFPIAYIAFLLYGPAGAVWVAALGTVMANVARRRAWRVMLFNATQFALASFIAGVLSVRWPGLPSVDAFVLPILIYTILWYGANNLIVDGLLWLRLRHYRYLDWADKTRLEALSAAIGYVYCVFMLVLAPQQRGHDPLALIYFFMPMVLVGLFVRLWTNLSQFARHMESLVAVSTLITYSPNDSKKTLEEALAHLGSFDDYRYVAIYRLEGEELAVQAVRGIAESELGNPRIPLGEGLTGRAALHATPIVSGEARQDSRNNLGEGVREQANMIAAIPLISVGQVMGVLTVAKERSHSIIPEDMRRLTIAANVLAAVKRNLHLAEERERLLLFEERNRLAREIHDGMAQSLAGMLLQMDRLERLIETDSRGATRVLRLMRESVRENLVEVRRSIWGLRPSPLQSQGLVEALRQEIETAQEKGLTGAADIRVEVRGEQRRLSGQVEDEVFRVAQEGLANALRHAMAREVTVGLQFMPDRLRLTIRDDGQGFLLGDAVRRSRDSDRGTFGMAGMSERAERLGAQFDVDSRPGAGTRLTLEVPLLGE